jgi:hypothetical protein
VLARLAVALLQHFTSFDEAKNAIAACRRD